MTDRRLRPRDTAFITAVLAGGVGGTALSFQPGEGIDMAVPALLGAAVVLTAVTAVVLVKVFEMPVARWKPWPIHAAIVYAGVLVASAPWAHALNRLLDFSPKIETHAVSVATWRVKTTHASEVRRTEGPRAWEIVRLGGEYPPGTKMILVTKRGLFGWEWIPAR